MEERNRNQIVAGIKSRFIVLMPDGQELDVSDPAVLSEQWLRDLPELHALVREEIAVGAETSEPPSIKVMKDLELVDYEPASDKGHFRMYPKGELIFRLLHSWAEEIAFERLHAYGIETPIIYDWDEPDIREQAGSFHEHHYTVRVPNDPNKKFILRFAGDFGLFRMMKDAQLTHRHLPVRMYEFAPSFRYENSGSLTGLRRLRGFWMPDIHSFCANLDQGLSEYAELFKRYTDLTNGTSIKYAVAFRVVEDFYAEHKADVLEMVRYCGRPVMIEVLSEMKHYWVLKHEINSIDNNNKVCQVSTVQLDIKDASLYGITYLDVDEQRKGCIIVHSSIGSPERWIYSLLEDAVKHTPPQLPLWLSPTQVRLIPVNPEKHTVFCEQLMEQIGQKRIRVDIDERGHSMNWRVRNAEREWTPYIIVVGDKEMEGGSLQIRARGRGQLQMTVEEFVVEVLNQTKDMPFHRLVQPLISRRPIFRGRD